MHELAPDIWTWTVNDQIGYLLNTVDGFILIDPPELRAEDLVAVGIPDYIYITSPEATRATSAIEKEFHCALMIHDEANTDLPITGNFMNKDIIPGGVKVIQLTGPSCALVWQEYIFLAKPFPLDISKYKRILYTSIQAQESLKPLNSAYDSSGTKAGE